MIYFVRHGETDFNLFQVSQGQLNTSLNRTGLKQAEEIAEKLKNYKFDYVISSPLNRALQTAEIILKYHKDNELILDKRIMEVSKGILEGTKSQDMYDEFFKDPHKYKGETKEDVFNRVSAFLKDTSKYKGKNILIVSHGGMLKYINFCLSGKDIKKDELIITDMKNCELVEIDF